MQRFPTLNKTKQNKKTQKSITNYQYNIKEYWEISLKTMVKIQFWLLIWTLDRNCMIIVATKQNLLLNVNTFTYQLRVYQNKIKLRVGSKQYILFYPFLDYFSPI